MHVKLHGGGLTNNAQTPVSRYESRQSNGPEQVEQQRPVGEQVGQSLFGGPRPRLAQVSDFPELQWLLVVLGKYKAKLAQLIGDKDADYELALAEDTIAAIDERGIIFIGAPFLLANKQNLPLIVGAIAHEIGHRPSRMRELNSKLTGELSREQLQALCLHEEIRADTFAGRGLAELKMPCEPLINFLLVNAQLPHPEYLPPAQRAEVIRAGHSGRAFRAEARRKLFPDYDRQVSARNHLGDW